MPDGKLSPNPWLWTIGALAGLVWAAMGVVVAAVGPSEYVPQVFHNYHVEHFAAFYILAALAALGLPQISVVRIGLGLTVLATGLAIFRMFIPRHQLAAAEDLVCDVAGLTAALAPILIGRFRQIATRQTEAAS